MNFYVIGIGNRKVSLPPQLQALVQGHTVFSGGNAIMP